MSCRSAFNNPSNRCSSARRLSVLTCLGIEYDNLACYSRSLAAWEDAWVTGRNVKDAAAQTLVSRAVGELMKLQARLGRLTRLQDLSAEFEGREITRPGTELVTAAREGLWAMQNEPHRSFRCDPIAVDRILVQLQPRRDGLKVAGTGSLATLTNDIAGVTNRFYRVRRQ